MDEKEKARQGKTVASTDALDEVGDIDTIVADTDRRIRAILREAESE